jgi:hypothetical protein
MRITNNSFQRNANISLIMNQVWQHPGISRVDMARSLGLNKSTVSNIVSLLIEKEFFYEAEELSAQPQGGRKPIVIRIRPSRCSALGIEIQPSYWRAVLLDLSGEVILERSGPSEGFSIRKILKNAVKLLDKPVRSLGVPVIGLSVGLPGIVDEERRVIIESEPFGTWNEDLSRALDEDYAVPVHISNDANSGAWCQQVRQDRKEMPTYVYLLIEKHGNNPITGINRGIGVGMGIVLDGKVYSGAHKAAGEYTCAGWRPPLNGPTSMPSEDLERLFEDQGLFEDYLEEIMRNLIPVLTSIDPDTLVMGGDLISEEDVQRVLRERLANSYYHSSKNRCSIEFSPFGYLDVARGAAAMIIRRLIALPAPGDSLRAGDLWDEVFQRTGRGSVSLLKKKA